MRAGFTIVEVVVALVLFAVALLGLAAVSAVAATALSRAVFQERSALHAAAVLDSLVFDPLAGAGSSEREGVRVSWSVDGATIVVTAQGGDNAAFVLRGVRVPRLPARLP